MSQLITNYTTIITNIEKASQTLQAKQDVSLLAVSKTKPAAMIRELFEAGQRDFGENYLQEALGKQQELSDIAVQWHYIGSIQRNKTKDLANNFNWVHTVERSIIAQRLAKQRAPELPRLNICIQVNIDNEESKSGCLPADAPALIREICDHDMLNIRGLMVIPSTAQTDAFKRTQELFTSLQHELAQELQNHDWDTLSMGMSGDYEEAIQYGASIIRVGSAIFGSRG